MVTPDWTLEGFKVELGLALSQEREVKTDGSMHLLVLIWINEA